MRRARALLRDERGSPIVEFAMLLPALLALIMGVGELAYASYVRAILAGAIQKAARDSGIQGGDAQAATLDAAVLTAVRRVAPGAAFATGYPLRKSYSQFTYITPTPEAFTDSNGNGTCDAGEPYTDVNFNGKWDTDPGSNGTQGGASDATVYTISITYPRLFPVAKIVGIAGAGTITATTILKNQPYASQPVPPTKKC